MRLSVRHITQYSYQTPVTYSVQRLVMTPQSFASQTVENWTLDAPGIANALSYQDAFGNLVHVVTARDLTGPFNVIAQGTVVIADKAGIVQGVQSPLPDIIYLRQTAFTLPSLEMATLALKLNMSPSNALAQLHGLAGHILEHVPYRTDVTTADTTAAQAFAQCQGVCQDHSHILIGLARAQGLPARYVTGYLMTGETIESPAAHAWAEVLVPDLGWVGFDVSNGKSPDENYVRVAHGLDAAMVTPVRGSRKGGQRESLTVEVRVEIDQQ